MYGFFLLSSVLEHFFHCLVAWFFHTQAPLLAFIISLHASVGRCTNFKTLRDFALDQQVWEHNSILIVLLFPLLLNSGASWLFLGFLLRGYPWAVPPGGCHDCSPISAALQADKRSAWTCSGVFLGGSRNWELWPYRLTAVVRGNAAGRFCELDWILSLSIRVYCWLLIHRAAVVTPRGCECSKSHFPVQPCKCFPSRCLTFGRRALLLCPARTWISTLTAYISASVA